MSKVYNMIIHTIIYYLLIKNLLYFYFHSMDIKCRRKRKFKKVAFVFYFNSVNNQKKIILVI